MFYIAENRAIEAFQAIRGNLENKFFLESLNVLTRLLLILTELTRL